MVSCGISKFFSSSSIVLRIQCDSSKVKCTNVTLTLSTFLLKAKHHTGKCSDIIMLLFPGCLSHAVS